MVSPVGLGTEQMESTFFIVWVWVLAAPVITVLAHRRRPTAWKPLSFGSLGLISVVALAVVLDASFVWPEANILVLCVAYSAYCFLAFSSLRIKRKLVRYSVLLIAASPIALGYLLGTVGALGLGFIVADVTQPAIRIETIEDRLVCRVTGWGAAMTDSGYNVSAYRQYGPFLERRVAKLTVNESADGSPANCSDVAKLLR